MGSCIVIDQLRMYMFVLEVNHAQLHGRLLDIFWSVNPVHWSSSVRKLVATHACVRTYVCAYVCVCVRMYVCAYATFTLYEFTGAEVISLKRPPGEIFTLDEIKQVPANHEYKTNHILYIVKPFPPSFLSCLVIPYMVTTM